MACDPVVPVSNTRNDAWKQTQAAIQRLLCNIDERVIEGNRKKKTNPGE